MLRTSAPLIGALGITGEISVPIASSMSESYLRDHYPENWPPIEYFVPESELQVWAVDKLRELVERNSGETEIDRLIEKHPNLLVAGLDLENTGHHGAWVIPKKVIRSRISTDQPGQIPDYLVGGRNSFGTSWYVVELKGANASLFSRTRTHLYLSGVANRGMCQLLEYIQFCESAQSYLRDTMKLTEFSSPKGYLFVGRHTETAPPRERILKSAINDLGSKIRIRSYDALLTCCERILGSYRRRNA